MRRGRPPPPLIDGRGQLSVSCRPSSSRPWLSSPLSLIPPFIRVWFGLRERQRPSATCRPAGYWPPPRASGSGVCAGAKLDAIDLAEMVDLLELHKGWPELAALIPAVDYGRYGRSVKHNRPQMSKNFEDDAHARSEPTAGDREPATQRPEPLLRRASDARAKLLLVGVALQCQRDQAIDQARIGQAARFPHFRIHADRRKPG